MTSSAPGSPLHLKAIAAMALNRVIGREGQIPWHLPADFKWFKQKTLGNFVIMGRKTFEHLGRPLPNRTNIVLTRAPRRLLRSAQNLFSGAVVGGWVPRIAKDAYQLGFERLDARDVWLVASLPRLLKALERKKPSRDVYVIGGGEVYAKLLPRCSDLYLTLVQREVEGDTFFPEFEEAFELETIVMRQPEFEVRHYRNRRAREK